MSAFILSVMGFPAAPGLSESLIGPSSEWIYVTLPLTLSVMATGLALVLGTVAYRHMKPVHPVGP
ncbi:MAG TPA: hypothetical protein PLJ23_06095 [Gemmatimonadales bacterium]|jgi:hypothetical protein|nr:hypothetical protein [Gemmatimonadales bacterium]